jgi:hypothetical protein
VSAPTAPAKPGKIGVCALIAQIPQAASPQDLCGRLLIWRPASGRQDRHAVPMSPTSRRTREARADGAARASLLRTYVCVIQRDDVLTLRGAASGCQLRAAARADMPRAGFNTLTRKSATVTPGSSRVEAKAGRRGGVPGDGSIGRGLTWARLTPSRSAPRGLNRSNPKYFADLGNARFAQGNLEAAVGAWAQDCHAGRRRRLGIQGGADHVRHKIDN